MSCPVNIHTVTRGIQDHIKDQLDKSELFNVADEIYTPKDLNSSFQSVMDNINDSFQEDIISPFHDQENMFIITDPSPQLLNRYLEEEKLFNAHNEQALEDLKQWQQDLEDQRIQNLPDEEYTEEDIADAARAEQRAMEEKGWTPDNLDYSLGERTRSSKAGTITKNKILGWLEKIGFNNIQTVSQLEYKGEKIQGNAYIDFMKGVMQIVEGKDDYALPEESMHILTQLIKQSRPELYDRMMKDITSFKLYSQVINDPAYRENKNYQTEEGNLNYDKIKQEAISKLLAEYLISKLEATPESMDKLVRVNNWWQSFVQWIREKFGIYKNPFKEALDEIDKEPASFGKYADISSDEVFQSAKSLDQIDKENPTSREIYDKIKNRPATLDIHKEDNHYYRDGKEVPDDKRVSSLTNKYYEGLFPNRNFDKDEEAFYEQSRKDGSYIHEIFNAVLNSFIDPETGLMRKNQGTVDFPLETPIQNKIAFRVQKYMKQFLSQYPEGTRFLSEQIIYDQEKDMYGTIDLLAIKADGTRDIIDWKSTLMKDAAGAKDYKKEGYYKQLNEYNRILKESYGLDKVGKIRAIPVQQVRRTVNNNSVLLDINMGDVDAAKINRDDRRYRPIISPEESTGSKTRDDVVSQLTRLYDDYIKRGYFKKDRVILDDVQEAIYQIRTTSTVDNLAKYFIDLRGIMGVLLKQKDSLLKTGSQDDISEALATIEFLHDIIEKVVSPSKRLVTDPTVEKKSRNALFTAAGALDILDDEFVTMGNELLNEQAERENIFNLLKPERMVNFMVRTFRSMGTQSIASVNLMYELTKKAYTKVAFAVDRDLKSISDLKKSYEDIRKKKGMGNKEAISMVVDMEKGRLHSKIDQLFYRTRDEVFDSRNPEEILKFVRENYDMTSYLADYNSKLEENENTWKNAVYNADKKKSAAIIKRNRENFEKTYDVLKYPVTAFGSHNRLVFSRGIQEEKWYSDKYKELLKPGNEDFLKIYEYFVEKNTELADTGALEEWKVYTFLPSVRKSLADIFSLEDQNILAKGKNALHAQYRNWSKNLTVGDFELTDQGNINKFTQEKIEKRFVPYLRDLPSEERSFDIFKIYALMVREIQKEKYLQQNDQILKSVTQLEKTKATWQQNRFGRIARDEAGRPKVSEKVGLNAPTAEKYYRAIHNGEALQVDSDLAVSFRFREKWNNSPIGKRLRFNIDPKTYKPTSISATKFLFWLNNSNQKIVLGVNLSSALANLFGGAYASTKLYHKYMTLADLRASWTKLSSGAFYASDNMKKNAALVDYFLPYLDNRERHKANQLSVNSAATVLSGDWLMAPMRKTSEIVQVNIFLALIENTGIVDGKLVNLREKAALDTGYGDRYADQSKTKEIEKAFNKKVEDYKKQYGLQKLAVYKTIKQGGKDKVVIDLPGIDRNSADVENLRNISRTIAKDSLGEMDEFDVAPYRFALIGRLFMTFKNWIPRQVDVRFGEFRYSQAHQAYEYGRFRMFARALSANYLQSIAKLLPFSSHFIGKGDMITRARQVYKEKMEEAKTLGTYNAKQFITEGEFVDRFIHGTDAVYAEFRTISLMMLLFLSGIVTPDPDDDPESKSVKALIRKNIDNLTDQIGFFYSPSKGLDILGGSAPVFSLVRNLSALTSDTMNQFFGFTLENTGWDDKGKAMQEKAKPVKRLFKVFPALNQILTYLPAINAETAKDWGVRVYDNNTRR